MIALTAVNVPMLAADLVSILVYLIVYLIARGDRFHPLLSDLQ